MRVKKKWLLSAMLVGVMFVLAACGKQTDDKGAEIAISDVLNSKKMNKIVVTENDDNDNYLVWAGYIGKGKIKAIGLGGAKYNYQYEKLKKLDDKDYKDSLIDMGKDTMNGYVKGEFETGKTDLNLYPDGNHDDVTGEFQFDAKFNGKDKEGHHALMAQVNKPFYSKITKKDKDDEWATYEAKENDSDGPGYKMHVKLGKGKAMNFKRENIDKATEKYDNVTAPE